MGSWLCRWCDTRWRAGKGRVGVPRPSWPGHVPGRAPHPAAVLKPPAPGPALSLPPRFGNTRPAHYRQQNPTQASLIPVTVAAAPSQPLTPLKLRVPQHGGVEGGQVVLGREGVGGAVRQNIDGVRGRGLDWALGRSPCSLGQHRAPPRGGRTWRPQGTRDLWHSRAPSAAPRSVAFLPNCYRRPLPPASL